MGYLLWKDGSISNLWNKQMPLNGMMTLGKKIF